jgi:hypothetical protein
MLFSTDAALVDNIFEQLLPGSQADTDFNRLLGC